MKFHCDRCKTRYSIADERVRGKILKIRCKNCEAVITVREGMDRASSKNKAARGASGAGKRASSSGGMAASRKGAGRAASAASGRAGNGSADGGGGVLQGAFAKAFGGENRAPDTDPVGVAAGDEPGAPMPDRLDLEWYVAEDGEQHGPFGLEKVKEWVGGRPPSAELFCWSEGFDDWLPVEKVSHFRGLPRRGASSAASAAPASASMAPTGAVGPGTESESADDGAGPEPLFAATMAALEAEGGPAVSGLDTSAIDKKSNGAAREPTDEDFDLDIGEASRVVKMPVLAAQMARDNVAAQREKADAVAGEGAADKDGVRLGSGTGGYISTGAEGRPGAPRPGTARSFAAAVRAPIVVPLTDGELPLAHSEVLQPKKRSHTLQIVIAVGIVAIVGAVMIRFALQSGEDSEFDPGRSRIADEALGYSLEPRERKLLEKERAAAAEAARKSKARRGSGAVRRQPPSTGNRTSTASTPWTSPFGKDDETTFGSDDAKRPLEGEDIAKAYRDNQLGVKLCYERALKKDPLLRVGKIYVHIVVAPDGKVTHAALSSQANTELGRCVVRMIQRWRFRKSPQRFESQFPLVFSK